MKQDQHQPAWPFGPGRGSKKPRREAFPYQWVEYEDSDLVYGNVEKVDPDFGSPRQKVFLEKVGSAWAAQRRHFTARSGPNCRNVGV